ncbi:MAG: hypothetical protein SFU56_02235 [Capsulimonadales bacterium]|nr:hypothetical protein [Capsulimonadales bacterium]
MTLMPGPAQSMQRAWRRRHIRRFEESLGLPTLTEKFTARYGRKVIGGPFEGMDYIRESTGSVLIPKLLGSYEIEVASALDHIFAQSYDTIVDIGCAEGYYAVGLARRFPGARVVAFDTDDHARRLCNEMATLNRVADRVEVRGAADFATLSEVLRGKTLTVCDCDGCEAFLLDPNRVPPFRTGDLLVELHDHLDPAISSTLRRNFDGSHHIREFSSRERNPGDWPALDFLTPEERKTAVGEYRPPQQWFFMTPRS